MNERDVSFPAMGCEIRVRLDDAPDGPSAADASERARRFVAAFDTRLSRFRPVSDLCALNRDPRPAVPTSNLLCAAVAAGRWAAQRTDGLVVPTLVDALERNGYASSRVDERPASLSDALAWAPPRRPARPDPTQRWREIDVDLERGVVHRPPGLRLDTGGVGKGLAADLLAHLLAPHRRFVVDCGGDIRVGGEAAGADPYAIEVEHPLTGECAHTLRLGRGAVATSGLNVRVWRRDVGGYAHHLLDPSTGEPAWTGLIGVTALATTALEAETLSKAAILSGPLGARRVLRARGGLLVHDDGDVELVGPLRGSATPVRIPSGALRRGSAA